MLRQAHAGEEGEQGDRDRARDAANAGVEATEGDGEHIEMAHHGASLLQARRVAAGA